MRLSAHGHVITLTHRTNGLEAFVCTCGEKVIGLPKLVSAMITAHRMQEFWLVRLRLTGST